MTRASGGAEPEGFHDFARAMGPRLFRTALLMCGDWHLAEDLAQTALGKLFTSWSRVRRADNADAYARTVLMRTYFSHRRLRRTAEHPTAALPDGIAPEHDSALRLTLLSALAELPAKDRAVVVLRYWEDRSVRETADALRMSEGSVRVRAARALTRLRTRLGEDGSGGGPGTGNGNDGNDSGKDGTPHGLVRR
ncbi:SigE family RNA polymerase sigma factor [Streptomyces vietnamensis]|uniref:SigE family RNA polymerase sigma factor n=1 Tax=Streptomyces vietnamensis TaxID=362257 RepID=UPI0007C65AD3|nr:SigE family RNA polymerase sigma factor [Streptomyces vietnamensis]